MAHGNCRRVARVFLACVLSAGVMLAAAPPAAAGDGKVDPFYGSFGTQVPIAAPSFRGLEPQVALNYNSSLANTFVGVGWSLGGFSYIGRASAGLGAPRMDSTDIYHLDGEELIPCTTLGGTHCTKNQNYHRITRSGDTWYVTQKNGTKGTYTVLVNTAAGPYRWALSTVEDTRGNSVSYSYSCDAANLECYPDEITYNGGLYRVKFFREPREDVIEVGIGAGFARTTYRLKSVAVYVNGSLLRAYKLTYSWNASTRRSQLASVQQFGRGAPEGDTVVGADGSVSGTHSLPALSMGYTMGGPAPGYTQIDTGVGWYMDDYKAEDQITSRMVEVDFNADGRADLLRVNDGVCPAGSIPLPSGSQCCTGTIDYTGACSGTLVGKTPVPMTVCLSNGDGTFACTDSGPLLSALDDRVDMGRLKSGDFNADGLTDIAWVNGFGGAAAMSICLSAGDGSFACSASGPPITVESPSDKASGDTQRVKIGDFNGDGAADVLYLDGGRNTNNPGNKADVCLNNGDGTFASCTNSGPVVYINTDYYSSECGLNKRGAFANRWQVGDFNGDGAADLLSISGDLGGINIFLSNRDGTFTGVDTGEPVSSFELNTDCGKHEANVRRVSVADFNGDGRADFSNVNVCNGTAPMRICLSRGDGTVSCSATGPDVFVSCDPYASGCGMYKTAAFLNRVKFGDFNGDGRTDVARLEESASTSVCLAGESGTFSCSASGPTYYLNTDCMKHESTTSQARIADFDGNGLADFAGVNQAPTAMTVWLRNGDGRPDLLSTIDNGTGGQSTITYAGSGDQSVVTDTHLPFGMLAHVVASVTTTDGRGASGTTSFLYNGGKWSPSERRFLGFRKVTGVLDAAGNFTETYYHQHVGCLSKPEATYFKDPTGKLYSYSSFVYCEDGIRSDNGEPCGTDGAGAPYTSLLVEQWSYECNLGTTCSRVAVNLVYDTYANVLETREHGNFDAPGDERTIERGFSYNTTAYIVGLPAYERRYEGIGTAGAKKKEVLYLYDAATAYTAPPTVGNLKERWDWNDQTGEHHRSKFTYDAHGNALSEMDAQGRTTTRTWDPTYHQHQTMACNPLSQCEGWTYDLVLGQMISATDTNGMVTSYGYDALSRPIWQTFPDGTRIDISYEVVSGGLRTRRASADGTADGLWTDTYQDGLGREYLVVSEGGATKETLYSDVSNRKWKESLVYQAGSETPRHVVYAYDGAGRPTRVTSPDGSFSETAHQTCFDAADPDFTAPRPCVTRTDELGSPSRSVTDGLGRTIMVSEWDGATEHRTRYTHDALDRTTVVTNAKSQSVTTTHDSLGRRLQVCDPDRGCTSATSFNLVGDVLSETDAKGQTSAITYDLLSRPLQKTRKRADGTVEEIVAYLYDEPGHGSSAGRLTTVTHGGGSDSYSYDAMGRVTSHTQCITGECRTLSRSFDAYGRLATITYPDGEIVAYGYDTLSRLTSVTGASAYLASVQYNARRQITALEYGNGVRQTYSYGADRGWLTSSVVEQTPASPGYNIASPTLYQASYAYDAAARVTAASSTTDPLLNLGYGYDTLDRLTTVTGALSQSYSYDAVGNITCSAWGGSYTYADAGHPNAVTAADGRTFAYDATGNMVSGGGRELSWDTAGRLASITQNGLTTTYTYGDGERRIAKSTAADTTRYFFGVVEEGAGGVRKLYEAGPLLVARQDAAGVAYFHADRLGSIQVMTNALGVVIRDDEYAPFGQPIRWSGAASNDIGFGGHRMDAESGLIYMGARYYDASLGRFISADSVVPDPLNPQALNHYSYAYNNPVSNVDPTGHAPVVIAWVAVYMVSSTAMVYVAVVGAVCVTVGYFTKNAALMEYGQLLIGASAGPWGFAVAMAQSSASPLHPSTKQAIGWAYTAYGVYSWATAPRSGLKTGDAAGADAIDPTGNLTAAERQASADAAAIMAERLQQSSTADVGGPAKEPGGTIVLGDSAGSVASIAPAPAPGPQPAFFKGANGVVYQSRGGYYVRMKWGLQGKWSDHWMVGEDGAFMSTFNDNFPAWTSRGAYVHEGRVMPKLGEAVGAEPGTWGHSILNVVTFPSAPLLGGTMGSPATPSQGVVPGAVPAR